MEHSFANEIDRARDRLHSRRADLQTALSGKDVPPMAGEYRSEVLVDGISTVRTYRVEKMRKTLLEAFRSLFRGLKVIVAEGECQPERQRRVKPIRARTLEAGERVVRTRFGVDEDTCTGDHSCNRLSECPTLTVMTATDPLKTDPVAHVTDGCVGCGVCGELAHAATLCPSFWRAEIISNPGWWDRVKARLDTLFTGLAQR